MSWGPLRLRTASEGITFDGEASPAPGGGSMPVCAEYVNDNPVSIADGANAGMPVDSLFTGVELLDHTDPLNPVFLADGVYYVALIATTTAPLTAGGFAQLRLTLGVLGASMAISAEQNGSAFTDSVGFTAGLLTAAQAGDTYNVTIANRDGVASRDFGCQHGIIKIG